MKAKIENENRLELMNFNAVNPDCITVPDIIDYKSSRNYISWGEDNKLPYFVWDVYLKCSDLQALVNTTADYIYGSDISITKPDYLLTEEDSFEDLLQKIIFDYILFGGFAVECIRNANNDIVRCNYINVMNIRVDEALTTAYLSNNWGSWNGKNVISLPLFDKNEQQPHFIFYYRGAITRNINPVAVWHSGLKSACVLNEVRNYNLNNIQNNFNANVMISLNGVQIKQAEMKEIKEKLEAGYTGTNNAGRTLLINNSSSEGKVEVIRLDSDKASDIYKNVAESSVSDLQCSFRINPILLGINTTTGFSSQEFEQAYSLYKVTVIQPLRNNISKALKKININVDFKDTKIDFGTDE